MDDEATVRSRPRASGPRHKFEVWVALDERALLIAAAKASSMPTSSWIRHQALRAAAGVSRPPGPFQPPPTRDPQVVKLKQSATGNFTDEEYEAIVEHARACGLPVAGLIRRLVLGGAPLARRPLLRSAIAEVHRAGVILLQLIHLAAGGAPPAPDFVRAVADLRGEIHALRDALLRADAAGAPDPAE